MNIVRNEKTFNTDGAKFVCYYRVFQKEVLNGFLESSSILLSSQQLYLCYQQVVCISIHIINLSSRRFSVIVQKWIKITHWSFPFEFLYNMVPQLCLQCLLFIYNVVSKLPLNVTVHRPRRSFNILLKKLFPTMNI